MTIYSLDELLFLFVTSLLFHVQFWLLLLIIVMFIFWVVLCLVTQLCPTLCFPMDCSLLGCPWVAIPSSRDLPHPRTAGRFFTKENPVLIHLLDQNSSEIFLTHQGIASMWVDLVGNSKRGSWDLPSGAFRPDPGEPLDESERQEWKSWLKAQHSEN